MTYKISTDQAIIEHVTANPKGALVHCGVGQGNGFFREGLVTWVVKSARLLTLQCLDGAKHTVNFNWISIPDSCMKPDSLDQTQECV